MDFEAGAVGLGSTGQLQFVPGAATALGAQRGTDLPPC